MANDKARFGVLIVEDNDDLRPLLVTMLDMCGYAVLDAANGQDGLAMLLSPQKVDLLVTDVRMPGCIDGEELVKLARKARPELKVLFITGYQWGMREDWTKRPGIEIMGKPFQANVFLEKVSRLLSAPHAAT